MFLYLQHVFGNIFLDAFQVKTENSSPQQTVFAIYNHAPRIVKSAWTERASSLQPSSM